VTSGGGPRIKFVSYASYLVLLYLARSLSHSQHVWRLECAKMQRLKFIQECPPPLRRFGFLFSSLTSLMNVYIYLSIYSSIIHIIYFNDAFGILLKLPRWTSAGQMFVSRNVPTFHAVLSNFMYKFKCRLSVSENVVIKALADPALSDTRYLSCFWKQWNKCLYVF